MRETYGVLSWLGDIGGLTDCLLLLGRLLLKPFTSFSLQTFLLSGLFRLQPLKTHKQLIDSLQDLKSDLNRSRKDKHAAEIDEKEKRKDLFIRQFKSTDQQTSTDK